MDAIQELTDEIQGLLKVKVEEKNWIEIEMYHQIGWLLVESGIPPKKINIPEYVKSNAIKFYKKYPIDTEELVSVLPFGSNVSWSKIKRTL
jgi:hypothetical protein